MKYALQKIEGFMSGTDMGFVEKMLYYEMILPDVFSTKEAKKFKLWICTLKKMGRENIPVVYLQTKKK